MLLSFLTVQALCMDFIRAFPDRLEEVTDYMIEKELRNRTPLEELDILLPEFKPEAPLKEEEVDLDDLWVSDEVMRQDMAFRGVTRNGGQTI